MLERLSPLQGSRKQKKRLGRGPGCHGKTSGKGHKGQRARAGKSLSRWFEGGQTPLKLRTPKRGFKNLFKTKYELVNVRDLAVFENDQTVSVKELTEYGLIKGRYPVKILGNGDIDKKINLKVNACSKSAAEKIEKAGGAVEII